MNSMSNQLSILSSYSSAGLSKGKLPHLLLAEMLTADSAVKSFAEGLVAPIIELYISLAVIALSKIFEAMLAILQFLDSPQAFVIDAELLSAILEMWGAIDLLRNLFFALCRPGNAVALAAGEALSLLFLASVPSPSLLAEGFRSAYHSCVIGILLIILGLVIRFVASIYAEV